MREVRLQIDGLEVKAQEGMTLLEAAKSRGIYIPTLCYHEKLEPYGGCRLCTVEIERGGRGRLVASCVYQVEEGLAVRTRSPKIDKIRKVLLELLLAHAPDSFILSRLAEEYGAERDRFEKQPSFCILCGLCVRYCAEVKKSHAITFVDRGIRREISFIPEIASRECWNCKECFPLCPTEYLQAEYVLMEAMVGGTRPSSPEKKLHSPRY